MNRIRVMHVIDTLEAGGAETVAVNLANLLPRERYQAYLCNTRKDGSLSDLVASDVVRLRLQRNWLIDGKALLLLVSFIRKHDIQIIHAHGSSVFIARLASIFPPRPKVVWHDHYGRHGLREIPLWLYRLAMKHIGGVITVDQSLAEWFQRQIRVPLDRIWYIPNFVCDPKPNGARPDLAGQSGGRIVCVANLRAEKDHLNLIRAMGIVTCQTPKAHLLLVGGESDPPYIDLLKAEIAHRGLEQHVSILGKRQDVSAILGECDIGVLSSATEGFPLALLEYGMAKLPVVATSVGQCPEILDEGRAGILVQPGSPGELAEALLSLLNSPERRRSLSTNFHRRIEQNYSARSIVEKICQIYDSVMNQSRLCDYVCSARPVDSH